MSEHVLLAFISVIVTICGILLGIIVKALFTWRDDIKKMVEGIKAEIMEQIGKFCEENEKDHRDLWGRVNHHTHSPDGCVIIPRKG